MASFSPFKKTKTEYTALGARPSTESEDIAEKEAISACNKTSYERKYRRLRIITIFLLLTLVSTILYTVHVGMHMHADSQSQPLDKEIPHDDHGLHAADVALGVDPFGWVPADLGQSLKWVMFGGKDDPYYVEEDVFDSLKATEDTVLRLLELDNPAIKTHGINTTYLDADGHVHDLRATTVYQGQHKMPVYFLRAFHQMHCIVLITDGYGKALHGRSAEARWGPDHFAHCVNVLREAVSCFADAQVASFIHPGDPHISINQQARCRDYKALREWADDPARKPLYENYVHEDPE
ncbi:uncharacterized protein M421DRAFT_50571 [Didymella exigua CBS 183.55]|uniref:Uncharacterized protein n=1 Tax=Didymella exigua CBS 183.55 TaxID=1150837 RepID=A0A6A5S2W4_9PLEO|nr:uncharacterized protein M421DRAFT_50571 [Didymella exigua CBS 183.55]KAF1934462.1 hypothetical protein M421DRAFT_50571 [Didymella exigua CBS 183.55]